MIKKLFDSGDLFLRQTTWKDLAVLKFCLLALGLLAGSFVPERHRPPARITALTVFLATYIPLMGKYFRILRKTGGRDFSA